MNDLTELHSALKLCETKIAHLRTATQKLITVRSFLSRRKLTPADMAAMGKCQQDAEYFLKLADIPKLEGE